MGYGRVCGVRVCTVCAVRCAWRGRCVRALLTLALVSRSCLMLMLRGAIVRGAWIHVCGVNIYIYYNNGRIAV